MSKGRKTTRRKQTNDMRNQRARPLQSHEKVTIGVQRLNVVRQTIERYVRAFVWARFREP